MVMPAPQDFGSFTWNWWIEDIFRVDKEVVDDVCLQTAGVIAPTCIAGFLNLGMCFDGVSEMSMIT